jgi:hypothetical protein
MPARTGRGRRLSDAAVPCRPDRQSSDGAGWRALRVLAETDKRLDPGRLDELIARARRQAELLEEVRVRAAGQVIGLGATAEGS